LSILAHDEIGPAKELQAVFDVSLGAVRNGFLNVIQHHGIPACGKTSVKVLFLLIGGDGIDDRKALNSVGWYPT